MQSNDGIKNTTGTHGNTESGRVTHGRELAEITADKVEAKPSFQLLYPGQLKIKKPVHLLHDPIEGRDHTEDEQDHNKAPDFCYAGKYIVGNKEQQNGIEKAPEGLEPTA